jgi:BlaI family penicillinase repressor
MRTAKSVLTDQELEIMKIVWQLEQATVRDVYEKLLEGRRIAYTTVMTLMKILETKGYLKKESSERAFIYRPSKPKKQVIRGMVQEFIDRVFNGSAEPLLLHLVEDEALTKKELNELVRLAKRRS